MPRRSACPDPGTPTHPEHHGYRLVDRPSPAVPHYPLRVLDEQGRLHYPLTVFANKTLASRAAGTARVYINAVLPYMHFLETDPWEIRAGRTWASDPESVRHSVAHYLRDVLGCTIQTQYDRRVEGRAYSAVQTNGHAHPGADLRSSVRSFLAALTLFYTVHGESGHYAYDKHPLHGAWKDLVDRRDAPSAGPGGDADGDDVAYPVMPAVSGVTQPRETRLTAHYFVLLNDEWIPQVISDSDFPGRIFRAGYLAGWGERDHLIARLLFEAGGRISEVIGLTMGDWAVYGFGRKAAAFSKGSNGVRRKFLRFSKRTADRLKDYVDGERRAQDPQRHTFASIKHLGGRGRVPAALYELPLFLSRRGAMLTPAHWRQHYWQRACQASGIIARPHQARHWYVTRRIAQIYRDAAAGKRSVEEGMRQLMAYMAWAWPEATLRAYNHYFDADRHADGAATLFRALDAAERAARGLRYRPGGAQAGTLMHPASPPVGVVDAEYAEILALGGA